MIDSVPIITCSGKRSGKVAKAMTDKGYCYTKSRDYYGVKLHVLAFSRKGKLPIPESIIVTPASENDLNVLRENFRKELPNRIFFADKIYQDTENEKVMSNYNSFLLSPVKYSKGVSDYIKKFNKAADRMFDRNVSAIRQPIESLFTIESLFNLLIERTNTQRASKVRSTAGLVAFIFGKLSAALIFLLF